MNRNKGRRQKQRRGTRGNKKQAWINESCAINEKEHNKW
jgi:hypothetical protein